MKGCLWGWTPVALMVKNPPANARDIRDVGSIPGSGRSPGGEHGNSSILAWRIPWTEEPGGLYSPWGRKELDTTEVTVETVSDFIFLGSKITADGDCSHEIKRRLLLGRKVMTNLDSVFKSRDVTLLTKVRLVKAMVFPVVMYGCESWTVKKSEH